MQYERAAEFMPIGVFKEASPRYVLTEYGRKIPYSVIGLSGYNLTRLAVPAR